MVKYTVLFRCFILVIIYLPGSVLGGTLTVLSYKVWFDAGQSSNLPTYDLVGNTYALNDNHFVLLEELGLLTFRGRIDRVFTNNISTAHKRWTPVAGQG